MKKFDFCTECMHEMRTDFKAGVPLSKTCLLCESKEGEYPTNFERLNDEPKTISPLEIIKATRGYTKPLDEVKENKGKIFTRDDEGIIRDQQGNVYGKWIEKEGLLKITEPFKSRVYNIREKGIEHCKTEGSSHYKANGAEPLDLMMSKGMFEGFCLGSIMKYAARFEENGRNLNDLKKIADYAHLLCGYILEEKKNG